MGVLISSSYNVGKTTFATRLAQQLGCSVISTDSLARHPGRPWPEVRPPVAEYYARLSPETIYWFLRVHHENMWPSIRQSIEAARRVQTPFVFEGSAIRPEYIAPLISGEVLGVFLYADNDFLRERMRSEAKYIQTDETRRSMIDKFIDRSLRDDSEMHVAATDHDVRVVDTSDGVAVATLFDELVERTLVPSRKH
ncbi:hypothetical protein [Rhizobium tumorigenes]|uniref:hypothetical protein n=1 Tax=Rhizobium tumorigenes TaxID=2041385 RepID=UPI00241CEC75|nr:hypothetical protein [Rhizobium tumorigenes]WFS03519.1 hypothetical protein PR016_19760 [Rhizobium tumorigenes]